ncbi:MAG: rRNA maturation RNase YbeY, partial [Alistipes sp.]|nr:rRNA maturation RNase YbeY [Alistipes sp.]
MAVQYYNDETLFRLPQTRLLARWLHRVAEEEGFRLDRVDYIFCSSEKHRAMNLQFVGHDYFTDIITFDYGDRKAGWVAGEVFIDVETVRDNARIYGTTFRREMRRVVVHGVLHLCGQKDKSPRDERTMHRKEDR